MAHAVSEGSPFLVNLFYRTGAFHRLEEFKPPHLPACIPIYVWDSCTLTQLSHHLAAATPPVLPSPSIGTRLCFRLIYLDTRNRIPNSASVPPRFATKDLGSIVIGGGGPGAEEKNDDGTPAAAKKSNDGDKTLKDVRFITGDYISAAILPPDPLTGEVVPASSARVGRGSGVGEGRGATDAAARLASPILSRRDSHYHTQPPSTYGGGGRGSRRGDTWGYGGVGRGRFADRDRDRDRSGRGRGGGSGGGGFPEGEWRRGERLPAPLGPRER
ncbi:Sin3 associated polypeptide p18-domain-containing protein [Podospora didyma]|uniref:Sin3 associated polypeptide p18-domain-containing protein n=1 Tax=Podospora didyma TaxID=330526 RepID=A0AAE0KF69_9PEZI|nr:Sin3 associated polypeptide p18-domain-containing protein [Podospora didyma]